MVRLCWRIGAFVFAWFWIQFGLTRVSPSTRIMSRPTEHDRLIKQRVSLQFHQTSLSEALSEISKLIRMPLTMDAKIRDRSIKITMHCSEMAPAPALIAIAAVCEGEWMRQEKGFHLVPLGQNPDPYESLLNRVEVELSQITPASLSSPEEEQRFQQIRLILDNRFAPWSTEDYFNSVVTRKQVGDQTTWSLRNQEISQVGDLYRERTQAKWWFYQGSDLPKQ